MQASELNVATIQQSRKIGSLRKWTGLSGFIGLAKVARHPAGGSGAGSSRIGRSDRPATTPAARLRLVLLVAGELATVRRPNSRPFRSTELAFAGRRHDFVIGGMNNLEGCSPVTTFRIRPQAPPATTFASSLLTVVLVSCLAASGCSNLASQAANVEGVRLYQQGNYQQASDRFQQAIAQDPTSPEGYYNLGASLHKTGTLYNRPAELQQAEVLYNQCLERDPSHVDCHRGLAVLLTETNRQAESFRLLNNWAAANPKSPEPKIELARLLEETGQNDQAKIQLVEALTVDPHNARALTALGRLRDQSGNYAQALSDYQRSLSMNRFQPDVAARVAQLQAVTSPPVLAPMAPSTEARTASGWQPSVRY
jgi:tetratricopeptide (TPR) repeat protein